MSKLLSTTLIATVASVMIFTAAPTPVHALPQAGGGGAVQVQPPRPRRTDGRPPILWSIAAAAIIIAAVAGANAIPSKRGHQD